MYALFVELVQPFSLLLFSSLGILISLWFRGGRPRRRLLALSVCLLLLAACCTPSVAHLALGSLEWKYPPSYRWPEEAQAIVVLSGANRPPEGLRRAELGKDTLYRCLHAAQLYRQVGSCPVVVTGGKVDPRQPGPATAELMRDFLQNQGVAANDLLVEDRSRSTYENARHTAALLRRDGIQHVVLVTDAIHLLRSQLCFERQGIHTIPQGTYYQAVDFQFSVTELLPRPSAAREVNRVFHEWVGIAWYWLHDRI